MGFPRVAPGSQNGTSRDVTVFGGLGDDELGFSLVKNVGKAVAKGVKDTAKQTVRSTKDVGHAAGAVVTSKVGQLVIGGALAATGVGVPAAAAISAAAQGGGNLIKKGGNLKKAAKGAAVGAGEGVVASVAGSAIRKAAAARRARSGAKGAAVNAAKPGGDASVLVDTLPAATALLPAAPEGTPVTAYPMATDVPQKSAAETASKVLGLGAKANRGAKQAAANARKAGSTADKIAAALAKAKEAGDAVGATGLAEQLAKAQEIAQNASGAAETAARQAEQIGAAAQAAAAGAVGEGAAQGFGDFIKSPAGMATAAAVVIGGGLLLSRGGHAAAARS